MLSHPFSKSLEDIRADFPILKTQVNGQPLIYLDNASTRHKPQAVIDAVTQTYTQFYSNTGRSTHSLGERATLEVHKTRLAVQNYIKAASIQEIIFTKNTTESVNLLAYSLAQSVLKKGDTLLVGQAEHHSHMLPWLWIAKLMNFSIEWVSLTAEGFYNLESLQKQLHKHKPKLLCLTMASNVLGNLTFSLKTLIAQAHKEGTWVSLDAAQAIAHCPIDVQDLNCDFLMFSAHKMCGPSGVGVLYGKKALLKTLCPPFLGGGTVLSVETGPKQFSLQDLPYRFEAGTPNLEGIVGFRAAIEYVETLGLQEISDYEILLTKKAYLLLKDIPFLRMLSPLHARQNLLSFTIENLSSHDLGLLLDGWGVAVRTGKHCAHPLFKHLNCPPAVRLSPAFYNTEQELVTFIQLLQKAISLLKP